MRLAIKTGLSFGLTSGVITTLGLMVGLNAGTHSKASVIGGILTIAIADACSDALGIHMSQEAQKRHTGKSVWESTISTFLTKFLFALTFVVPVLFFDLASAVWVSLGWGLAVLGIYSYILAKQQGEKPGRMVVEHLAIATMVIIVTQLVGSWIGVTFR